MPCLGWTAWNAQILLTVIVFLTPLANERLVLNLCLFFHKQRTLLDDTVLKKFQILLGACCELWNGLADWTGSTLTCCVISEGVHCCYQQCWLLKAHGDKWLLQNIHHHCHRGLSCLYPTVYFAEHLCHVVCHIVSFQKM